MRPVSIFVAYMPLVDAAPLIIAQELGFAQAEGIALELIAAPSWSSVRDMLAFGRVDAARAAGVAIELIPGVTAAAAAAASIGQSLTQRGVSDTLILSTGAAAQGAAEPDATRLAGPGTTSALYMSVAAAERIAGALMRQGLPAHSPVEVCVNVSKPDARHITTSVGDLAQDLQSHGVKGCAVLLVTWPKSVAHVAASGKTMHQPVLAATAS